MPVLCRHYYLFLTYWLFLSINGIIAAFLSLKASGAEDKNNW
jgi:hypothetical protein